MTRKKMLSYFRELITENDLILYIGEYICIELEKDVRNNELLLPNEYVDYFSIAAGLAMTNERKVLVVLEDRYLLSWLSAFTQAIVSDCRNLFFIVLNSSIYSSKIKQPTLFNSLRSITGMIVNIGALVHNYDRHFKNKSTIAQFKLNYSRMLGPAVGIITLKDNTIYENTNLTPTDIESFTTQSMLGVKTEVEEEPMVYLNLDEIMKKRK